MEHEFKKKNQLYNTLNTKSRKKRIEELHDRGEKMNCPQHNNKQNQEPSEIGVSKDFLRKKTPQNLKKITEKVKW